MKKLNLLGIRFGRLLVKSEATPYKYGPRWLCQCDCGNEAIIATNHLSRKNRPVQSCGCILIEFMAGNQLGKANKGQPRLTSVLPHLKKNAHNREQSMALFKKTFSEKGYHILYDLDTDKMTADCTVCGLVPVKSTKSTTRRNNYKRTVCWVSYTKDGSDGNISVAYPNQALEMFEAQQGLCAVCGEPFSGDFKDGKAITLDHDHQTGLIRGFLHQNCNKGIGHFNDDPAKLRQAADYLEKPNYRPLL